jgi:hypothetical protein
MSIITRSVGLRFLHVKRVAAGADWSAARRGDPEITSS